MTEFNHKNIIEELQHLVTCDCKGKQLEGERQYKIVLPPNIPASDFWSIIVYDLVSRLIIKTDQPWPSVFSNDKNMVCNIDGSIEVWFGPEYIEGKEGNWVKTLRGKPWYMILRLYYPLESWFNKEWQPGEIVEIV